MKIVAVGIGQCGANIVDDFYYINGYAKSFLGRRIAIVNETFAVNTDEADLLGLRYVPKDKLHRIVVGSMRTFGHGVGKLNREAAQIMKEGYSVIADRIFASNKFHESDAIVVIASAGGGTGSGSIGPLIKQLRERVQKPIYAVIVLPFSYEERGETSYAVTNSATCLEMVSRYADAVFLLDNERFAKSDISLSKNLSTINREMVKNFYDLFTAGEEKHQKFIGSKVIDAGDIKASLDGITAIGRGEIGVSASRLLKDNNFQEGVKEHTSAAGALYQAENNLSLKVDLRNAGRIMVLVSAPKDIITLGLLEGIATYLQNKSPQAVVRIGDYPRRRNEISVTLIASKLTKADRVEETFLRAHELFAKQDGISKEQDEKVKQLWETAKGLPSLDT
jgi:tubulin-like protein CetZ